MNHAHSDVQHFLRKTCRLCGSLAVAVAVPLRASPIGDDFVSKDRLDESQPLFPLDLYLCQICSHVQLLDVVSPSILFRNYTYNTSLSLGLVDHFKRQIDQIISLAKTPRDSFVVDVGSNDGSVLRIFQNQGYRVLGIDPAREIAQKATDSGVETLPEFLTDDLAKQIKLEHGEASIVVANNVFAHADDLGEMAKAIRTLLKADGIFVFEVSYLVDIIEKSLFDTVYHEHLCYHSVKPLQIFLKKHGMELFNIERIPTKGGSIRGYAQPLGGPRPLMPIIEELLLLESKGGYDQLPLYQQFSARLNLVKVNLLSLIQELKSSGKTVAGYGASQTVTTLMYHFELTDLIDFLVDDNPIKHGKFSPGAHLPVYSSDILYEKKVDATVILAWAYEKPIVAKHSKYMSQGGLFILPMPEVRILKS